jgi:hypothetical protein
MFPLDGFASSLILETSMRTCRENPNLVKNRGAKISDKLHDGRKDVLLSPAKLHRHKSALFGRNGIRL